MDLKIMYGALIFVAGWFYFYICLRQFIYDFTVGYPLIKKFGDKGESIFAAKPARSLNTISAIVWFAICAGLGFVVVYFCATYLMISFWIGVALGVVVYFRKLGPTYRPNFEAFCRTYYRFMPDDELRTATYNADYPRMRAALRALNCDLKLDISKE